VKESPRHNHVFEPIIGEKNGMLSIFHPSPGNEFGVFRFGKLPDVQFDKGSILDLFTKEISCATGIRFPKEETAVLWNMYNGRELDEYEGCREYFLDGGILGWDYVPQRRIPGERWRFPMSYASHEISAVLLRIKMFREGFLTIEERLTRWGLVRWIGIKI
jgi:hypothetical protein